MWKLYKNDADDDEDNTNDNWQILIRAEKLIGASCSNELKGLPV